jgi:hypothetical protein
MAYRVVVLSHAYTSWNGGASEIVGSENRGHTIRTASIGRVADSSGVGQDRRAACVQPQRSRSRDKINDNVATE